MSKKLSWTPISFASPNTSCQIAASFVSSSLRGATYSVPLPASPSGIGSAFRSIFPFGVRGRRSSSTKYDGIMYPGSSLAIARFRSAAVKPSSAV
ncbi:hypothetical protein D3C73_658760 [compost metagenome]